MTTLSTTAKAFFDACESGKGWDVCSEFCHANASFSSQTGALAGIDTLADYCEWMKNLFTPIPDGSYKIKGFGFDDERQCAVVYGVFSGTQTGAGGPVPPTGNKVETDYVYHIVFDGDKISQMTKIWHDGIALQQLGWA